MLAAVVVLVAFGAVWLSVRGQHPYTGPTAVSLVVLYAVVLVSRIGTVAYAHRARTAGVSGRSVSQRRAEGAALDGGSGRRVRGDGRAGSTTARGDGIVYGVYVVTATLLVLGTFWAARSAVREDWLGLGVSIAFVVVAAGSAFAGPRGVWLSDGVGCCIVLVGYERRPAWLLRASRSDA